MSKTTNDFVECIKQTVERAQAANRVAACQKESAFRDKVQARTKEIFPALLEESLHEIHNSATRGNSRTRLSQIWKWSRLTDSDRIDIKAHSRACDRLVTELENMGFKLKPEYIGMFNTYLGIAVRTDGGSTYVNLSYIVEVGDVK